jgi:hypothetical protein
LNQSIDQLVNDINKKAKDLQNKLVEKIEEEIEDIFEAASDGLTKSIKKGQDSFSHHVDIAKADIQKVTDDSNDMLHRTYLDVSNLLRELSQTIEANDEKNQTLSTDTQSYLSSINEKLNLFNETVVKEMETFHQSKNEQLSLLVDHISDYKKDSVLLKTAVENIISEEKVHKAEISDLIGSVDKQVERLSSKIVKPLDLLHEIDSKLDKAQLEILSNQTQFSEKHEKGFNVIQEQMNKEFKSIKERNNSLIKQNALLTKILIGLGVMSFVNIIVIFIK